jgi:hypothetical protein
MPPETAFQSYLEGALESFGIEADETERMVMTGIWSLYEPNMLLLVGADLDGTQLELNVDLSKAPPR